MLKCFSCISLKPYGLQVPLSMEFSRHALLQTIFPPRDQSPTSSVSCTGAFFTASATWEAPAVTYSHVQMLYTAADYKTQRR